MEKNIGGGYVYSESDSSASYADKGFSVEALNDVEVSNPENGQALVYDSSSEKWVNGSVGGGGFTLLHGTYSDDTEYVTLPITASALYALMQTSPVAFDYTAMGVDSTINTLVHLTSAKVEHTEGYPDSYFFVGNESHDFWEATGWFEGTDAVVLYLLEK